MDKALYNIINRKFIITEYGKEILAQDYALGYSQKKIANKFKVSEDVIRRFMKECNIPTRKRKYNIEENYFHTIDTPEKAYWLGMLSADGYTSEDRGTIQLELQESDKQHIEKFIAAIKSNRPILEIRTGKDKQFLHYRAVINCRTMVNDLIQYNVRQAKSLTFYPINVPDELFGYWILGYMDGDGCIFKSKNNFKISFTGTEKTLQMIKDYFNSTNQIKKEHRCDNTYQFTLEVQKSKEFLKNIKYKDLSFVLERKKQRYCSFIQ